MNGHTSDQTEGARPVPAAALAALTADIEANGGPLAERPEDRLSAGRTMFDTPGSEDNTLTVLVPRERMRELPNQALVRIESREDGRTYLGVVVAGPFAEPDGLRGDAPVVVTAAVHGGMFLPRYHGRVQVELLGERADGALTPPRWRPLPNSFVFPLTDAESMAVLHTGGDVRLGLAVGHEHVEVALDTTRKDVLPRHTAILGTTGGGKSTTVAGLVGRLQQAGVAVILLDTEGEYTALNEPCDDKGMLAALGRAGMASRGVDETHLFHLVGRESANPNHPDVHPFRLRFSDLSVETVCELLDLPDAQRLRFGQAYELAQAMLRELGLFPRRGEHAAADQRKLLDLDPMETGYPGMTLALLLDVITVLLRAMAEKKEQGAARKASKAEKVAGVDGDEREGEAEDEALLGEMRSLHFRGRESLARLKQRAARVRAETSHEVSWIGLRARLNQLYRLAIFDREGVHTLPVAQMLQPGRVSIIDLHDSDSPAVNNIVIASLLREVQRRQDEAYARAAQEKAAGTGDGRPTPVVVIVEEAHEFLSRERIKRMPVLAQQLARIARRGRKRWLGLCFVTQLPQHLPDEVLGLVNNVILHKIADAGVIGRLKQTVPGIDPGLWSRLPALAPGQAIVSLANMSRPLLVAVDPAPAKLRMVE